MPSNKERMLVVYSTTILRIVLSLAMYRTALPFLTDLLLSPCRHDEGIVDGDADDLLHSLRLEVVSTLNVA